MKLRDHPALNTAPDVYSAWPPIWAHVFSKPTKRLTGEVGIFKESYLHDYAPNRLFLRTEYRGERYMGCLMVGDVALARQLHQFLKEHAGKSIQEIGDLDVAHLV